MRPLHAVGFKSQASTGPLGSRARPWLRGVEPALETSVLCLRCSVVGVESLPVTWGLRGGCVGLRKSHVWATWGLREGYVGVTWGSSPLPVTSKVRVTPVASRLRTIRRKVTFVAMPRLIGH